MGETRISNPDQHKILRAFAVGNDIAQIATDTALGKDYVFGIVSTLASLNRAHARELVVAYEQSQRPTPPVAAPVRAAPEIRGGASSADVLLARAERHSSAHIRQRAKRIRGHLAELGERLDVLAAEEDARARVAKLEAELAKAREELRSTRKTPSRPTVTRPQADDVPPDRVIRAWAAGNGITVPVAGKLSRKVVESYLAAHADNRAVA